MIKIQVVGTEKVIARLDALVPRIRAALMQTINQESFALQNYIQTTKLSGQILNVKSGALRSAVSYRVQGSDNQVVGVVYVSLGQVPYAAIHEYGGDIRHPGGTAYFISGRSGGEYVAGGPTFVANRSGIAYALPRTRAHIIKMPERSYMRSALNDRKGDIANALRSAVTRALRGG